MATVLGANATLGQSQETSARIGRGQQDARVKLIVDSYEASAIAIGTLIEMGMPMQKGARVQEVVLHTDNLQNNATLTVGDYEVAARYITAIDHGAAELITRLNTIIGRNYETDETFTGKTVGSGTDLQIVLTTGAGEATGSIILQVYYTKD